MSGCSIGWLVFWPTILRLERRVPPRAGVRIGIVPPYIVIYRYTEDNDIVTILRIVHGRRNITRTLAEGRR